MKIYSMDNGGNTRVIGMTRDDPDWVERVDCPKPILFLNPENPKQARCFLCLQSMNEVGGEFRHAQIVMRELAEKLGFRILDAIPQSIADGWDFWIEWDNEPPQLPDWFGGNGWKPVGQA